MNGLTLNERYFVNEFTSSFTAPTGACRRNRPEVTSVEGKVP